MQCEQYIWILRHVLKESFELTEQNVHTILEH